jgi:hypothetical protein
MTAKRSNPRRPRALDLTGQVFGPWKVMRRGDTIQHGRTTVVN